MCVRESESEIERNNKNQHDESKAKKKLYAIFELNGKPRYDTWKNSLFFKSLDRELNDCEAFSINFRMDIDDDGSKKKSNDRMKQKKKFVVEIVSVFLFVSFW